MPELRKGVRYERSFADNRLIAGKATNGSGPGYIEGYLAVFGNVDFGNERIIKGAFSKTVKEQIPGVPFMTRHIAHGGDALDTIGTISEAKEDDFGLWIHADMLEGDDAAEKIRSRVAGGVVRGMSVGFQLIRGGWINLDGKEIYEIQEAKLIDGVVTVIPMNELAHVTAAKSGDITFENLIERVMALEIRVNGKQGEPALPTKGAAPSGDTPEAGNLDKIALQLQRNRILLQSEGLSL